MMCFKDFLIFAVLIPMPSASPVFLAVFAVALLLAVKPCGYCLTLLAVLFLSTSPSSPFLNLPTPAPLPSNASLTSPIPDRTWFTLNGGRIFDPVIVAYHTPLPSVSSTTTTRPFQNSVESVTSSQGVQGVKEDQDRDESSVWVEYTSETGHQEKLSWWPGKWKLGLSSNSQQLQFSPSSKEETNLPQPMEPDAEVILDANLISAISSTLDTLLPNESDTDSSPSLEEIKSVRPETASQPSNYVDARYFGLGLVLDFGWRRTEEGLTWEREHGGAKVAEQRRKEALGKKGEETGRKEEEKREQEDGWIRQLSNLAFVGSW